MVERDPTLGSVGGVRVSMPFVFRSDRRQTRALTGYTPPSRRVFFLFTFWREIESGEKCSEEGGRTPTASETAAADSNTRGKGERARLMAVMPLMKFGALAIRTLSKPVANAVKRRCLLHPRFRAQCVAFAQRWHR